MHLTQKVLIAVGVMVSCFSLSALAQELRINEGQEETAAAREAAELLKLAPGCDFTVEVGERYRSITDNQRGRSYLMTFFDDGRVASFETEGAKFVAVYEGRRAKYAIDVNSGRTISLDSGKGPDWYANLRAQGKLPSPRKIVAHICSSDGAKFLMVQDPLIASMTTTDYWNEELGPSFYVPLLVNPDPLMDCMQAKMECHEECEQTFDVAAIDCGLYGLTWSAMAGPEIGGLIGLACAGAATYQKWSCIAACDARYKC
jgi:hypothetical protein